jgi:hypothetical protein
MKDPIIPPGDARTVRPGEPVGYHRLGPDKLADIQRGTIATDDTMPHVSKLKPPRLRYVGRCTGLSVYIVDGERVRHEHDIDFTMGGNEAIYPKYVPKGEIWIDDALHPLDATATTFHEIVERDLMMRLGWSYDDAHDAASACEIIFRKDLTEHRPSTLDLARVEAAFNACDTSA